MTVSARLVVVYYWLRVAALIVAMGAVICR
jgi:hypothetical protein